MEADEAAAAVGLDLFETELGEGAIGKGADEFMKSTGVVEVKARDIFGEEDFVNMVRAELVEGGDQGFEVRTRAGELDSERETVGGFRSDDGEGGRVDHLGREFTTGVFNGLFGAFDKFDAVDNGVDGGAVDEAAVVSAYNAQFEVGLGRLEVGGRFSSDARGGGDTDNSDIGQGIVAEQRAARGFVLDRGQEFVGAVGGTDDIGRGDFEADVTAGFGHGGFGEGGTGGRAGIVELVRDEDEHAGLVRHGGQEQADGRVADLDNVDEEFDGDAGSAVFDFVIEDVAGLDEGGALFDQGLDEVRFVRAEDTDGEGGERALLGVGHGGLTGVEADAVRFAHPVGLEEVVFGPGGGRKGQVERGGYGEDSSGMSVQGVLPHSSGVSFGVRVATAARDRHAVRTYFGIRRWKVYIEGCGLGESATSLGMRCDIQRPWMTTTGCAPRKHAQVRST